MITHERILEIQEFCDGDTLDLMYPDEVEFLIRCYDGLERLVADLETNSEAGAPDYAHNTLAS